MGPEARIGGARARAIGLAFRSRGLALAVLGSYINPIHPDPARREEELSRFEADLEAAAEMGAGMVATETGSLAGAAPQPAESRAEAFGALEASLARLLRRAEAVGLPLAIEAAYPHAARGAPELAALLARLDHPLLRALLDPANLLGDSGDPARTLSEALSLLGPRVAAVHAKNLSRAGGGRRVLPAFEGELDLRPLVPFAEERGLPVLFEDGSPEELVRGRLTWESLRRGLAARPGSP